MTEHEPWTEERLADLQRYSPPSMADLYRLARLGLVAEAVGQATMREAVDETAFIDWDTKAGMDVATKVHAFLDHPAWEERR